LRPFQAARAPIRRQEGRETFAPSAATRLCPEEWALERVVVRLWRLRGQ
jgi:hypothetical protein